MRTTDFIFIMINLYFLDVIDNNVGYLVHGIYYVLLFVWLVYKLKTIKLEYELKKREIDSYTLVRSGTCIPNVERVELNSCESCGKIKNCSKLKKGDGRPTNENKDLFI